MNFKKYVLIILTLSSGTAFSGTAGGIMESSTAQKKIYIGAFGGWSTSGSNKFAQSGVAYRFVGQQFQGQTSPTDEDYNLFVNLAGRAQAKTGGIAGLHAGYKWGEFQIGKNAGWDIHPAIELEGYYLGTKTSGSLSNPQIEPAVLPDRAVAALHGIPARQHTFSDSFNLNMGIFLINSMFTLKSPLSEKLLPYVGAGMGVAYNSISDANSAQTGPYPENSPYINHFNSNPSGSTSVFAAQAKAGIKAEITDHISFFGEYRYMYISPTGYTFGSTQYPNQHPNTSPWSVTFNSMNLNAGVFGIEYSV